jgi:two-component system phosphate regulon sensor histidine kinase PhoR
MLVAAITAIVILVAVLALGLRTQRGLRAQIIEAGREISHARGQLQASDARRTATFDQFPIAAIRIDTAGRIQEINGPARTEFPHVGTGTSILESFGEHRLSDEVASALIDGQSRALEVRLFADARRTYRVAIEVLDMPTGPEAIVFFTDFTDAAAYQELRSQFSANVSHELRTPLTGLAGLLEALGDPEIDDETHARFVERASMEVQRLVALITDVLFLSELEAPSGEVVSTSSDLASAVGVSVEALARVATEVGVRVEVAVEGPIWVPLTERMSITVVQNLLENAIKYGGSGAVASLRTERSEDGHWVELICRDTGPGIPERHLPHIFDRFYRADASRSKRLGGTGLGLSIVKHIAERFGGGVSAESREGFGTTITVRVPTLTMATDEVARPAPEGVSQIWAS